jgi:hypothetical protein
MEHERNNLEVQQTTVLNGDKDGGNVIHTAKLHVIPNLQCVVVYSYIMLFHLYVRINGGGVLIGLFSDLAASWMIQDSILSMDKRCFLFTETLRPSLQFASFLFTAFRGVFVLGDEAAVA